ncbi:MAG: type II toxin-antitoxin system PemK/MazF family toxin [bacterium]
MKKDIQQGEIWLVDFNPTKGQEINKIRPALVINGNFAIGLNLKIVCPITSWKNDFKNIWWLHHLKPDKNNHLDNESAVNCYQIRCVTNDRFLKQIGKVGKNLEEIIATAQNCIELT